MRALLPKWSMRRWVAVGLAAFLLLAAAAAVVWREDILRTGLDPKVPYQTYDPPPAPDYARPQAWALIPRDPTRWTAEDPVADVFFVHPTAYDGGRHWNAPIGEQRAERTLQRVQLPNYAGPFARVGRVFAPRYRHASLYSMLTLREDARDARRFAYEDVRAAFDHYLTRYNRGRPVVVVGVEQGGTLAARLVREASAADPELSKRLAAVYLIETVVPRDAYGPAAPIPACTERGQTRCVVAYASVREGDEETARERLERALVWGAGDEFETLDGRTALCVNPILGERTDAEAPARLHRGAAAATGFEWGARPGLLSRQVSARCENGLLRFTEPRSAALRPSGGWADRQKAPPFNLFYADLEADAQARVAALYGRSVPPRGTASIDEVEEIRARPVRPID